MENQVIVSLAHLNQILDNDHKIPMKRDKSDEEKLVGWLKKNDILYMIKISCTSLTYLLNEFDRHTFRLNLAERTGTTKTGETLQLVEILCDDEMSEEEIYRSELVTFIDESRVYDEIAEDNYRYSRDEDEGFGGLTGEEAELAKWNCD